MLRDVVGCHRSTTHNDFDRVLQGLARQCFHRLWECRREQDGLAIGAHRGQDGRYLWGESHIVHSIGFVHDDVRDALQRKQFAGLHRQDVNQPARSRDAYMDAALEVGNLFCHGCASINGSGFQTQILCVRLAHQVDLIRKFACRGQYHSDRSRFMIGQRRLIGDVSKHGQQVGERFSAACLGDTDRITPSQDARDALCLDWIRRGDLLLVQHLHNAF
mmetsp:Transcript_23078/g.65408  ORF Transcript_23078/g.65408 Transcript_23078/m.65408 type:complete len:218 (-) Transcript_23078:1006-1659(-)